jgi:SWI/SNF-related matrix-associated actin-dependent regulator 1 of chromatin subfamily A
MAYLDKLIEIKNPNYITTRPNTFKGITSTVISIYFPYNASLVSKVKSVPSVSFGQDDRGNKCWTLYKLDQERIAKLRTFALENKFDISESVEKLIKDYLEKEKAKIEQKTDNLTASSAQDAKIEIKNLGGELRPFQKAGVAYALKNKRCFIADEMGLGKTVQALATVQAANAYPALVICPASLKYNWQREANKWNVGKSTSILSDNDIGNENRDIVIINYDILEKRKDELDKIPFKSIIFDESQYCKNYKAKRTQVAQELSKDAEYRLALTGTPILNRPQELLSQLQILGRINDMGGFWNFAKRYCNAHQTRYGWDMSGASNLEELNTKLRENCYIRRNKKDIMKELPPIQRVIVPLDLSNKKEYDKVEKDLAEWLKRKVAADEEFQNSLIGLSEEEKQRTIDKRVADSTRKAESAEQLTKIEATKQMSAKGKIKAFKEWTNDFIESGEKLVIFADHHEIVNDLAKEFNADKIDGETSTEDRQKAVDKFQDDPNTKILVCNIKAGGVGLTLTAASNVAFLEQGWNPATHDQAEARCYGRINDPHAVTAWYFNGKDTIDDWIYNLIQDKRDIVSRMTTGQSDDSDKNTIMKQLTELLIKKNSIETKPEIKIVQPKVDLTFKEPTKTIRYAKIKDTTKKHKQESISAISTIR